MSNQDLSLRDFKQWLAGVEEMQGEDWVPNKEQWKKIREKINSVVETQQPVRPAVPMPPQHSYPPAPGGSSLVLDSAPPRRMPPQPVANLPPAMLVGTDAGAKAVTPSIDTSNGNYNSPFQ